MLNALNKRAIADLRAAFEDARDDSEVHGVILTGAGDKAFIAGADINEVATDTPVQAEEKTRRGQELMNLIENLGKPVIATAWSGNTSFMDHGNACLISYTLVPIVANTAAYSRASLGIEAKWAEPDVDEASRWMARLVTEPRLREEIGSRAKLRARQLQVEAQAGRFLREIEAIRAMKAGSNTVSRQQRFDAFVRTAGAAGASGEAGSTGYAIAQRSLRTAMRAIRRLRSGWQDEA